jgi:hypothetical protein
VACEPGPSSVASLGRYPHPPLDWTWAPREPTDGLHAEDRLSCTYERRSHVYYRTGFGCASGSTSAVVLDEQGRFITPVLTLHTRPRELDQLLTRARNGEQEAAVQVVMEPTGMAWFPVAVYGRSVTT